MSLISIVNNPLLPVFFHVTMCQLGFRDRCRPVFWIFNQQESNTFDVTFGDWTRHTFCMGGVSKSNESPQLQENPGTTTETQKHEDTMWYYPANINPDGPSSVLSR